MTEQTETQELEDFQEQSPVVKAYEEVIEVRTAMGDIGKLKVKYKDNDILCNALNEVLRNMQTVVFQKLIAEHEALQEIIEKE